MVDPDWPQAAHVASIIIIRSTWIVSKPHSLWAFPRSGPIEVGSYGDFIAPIGGYGDFIAPVAVADWDRVDVVEDEGVAVLATDGGGVRRGKDKHLG